MGNISSTEVMLLSESSTKTAHTLSSSRFTLDIFLRHQRGYNFVTDTHAVLLVQVFLTGQWVEVPNTAASINFEGLVKTIDHTNWDSAFFYSYCSPQGPSGVSFRKFVCWFQHTCTLILAFHPSHLTRYFFNHICRLCDDFSHRDPVHVHLIKASVLHLTGPSLTVDSLSVKINYTLVGH